MNATAPVAPIQPSGTAASIGHQGTLLWIGPRRDPEMVGAYQHCESIVPQLAYRASIGEACLRPAQLVALVIFARRERSPIEPEQLEHLRQSYPEARLVCLLSSGCEGEMRTGDPWPDCKRIYWHRWNQEWPDLLVNEMAGQDRGTIPDDPAPSTPLFLTIVAASFQQAEPFLEVASENRWPATWITPGKYAAIRSPTHVLWDDSAARPADRQVWRQRLSLFAPQNLPARESSLPLHAWFAGFPRIDDWREAQSAGVDWLLSKPASLSSLVRFVAKD